MSSIAAHQCCITYQTMSDPVIDNDGHTYEREAIEQWVRIHGTSPITRRPMSVDELRPNRAVLDAISELREETKVVDIKKQDLLQASVEIRADSNCAQVTVDVADEEAVENAVRIAKQEPGRPAKEKIPKIEHLGSVKRQALADRSETETKSPEWCGSCRT